jgi:hypothetical protein
VHHSGGLTLGARQHHVDEVLRRGHLLRVQGSGV